MQYLLQRLKQCKENSESIERRMTYSKVQCNLKYILWSKLPVELMCSDHLFKVLSSVPLNTSVSCCGRQGGMAAAMHCVSGRNILTPQPFTWSSWCHPLLCHFHFAFGSCHCTNKYSFSGSLSSVVWANRTGPWGHSARLWVLPVGLCQALLADAPGSFLWHWPIWASLSLEMGHCTNVSTGWWGFLLYFSWSTFGASALKNFVVCSWKTWPDVMQ